MNHLFHLSKSLASAAADEARLEKNAKSQVREISQFILMRLVSFGRRIIQTVRTCFSRFISVALACELTAEKHPYE